MRKSKEIKIEDEGRDKGRTYIITEKSAADAEEWGFRLLMAMINSDVAVPDDLAQMGIVGIAQMGISAFGHIKPDLALPLFREMMECVTIKPDPNNPDFKRALQADDIEEIATRVKLRIEIVKLHTGFFGDADN